ncbi:MAG: lycopene cyclase family protein [Microscillaceae bacterium]|nr:lycopene cyclase family protein [Microscillaceae bacterium]
MELYDYAITGAGCSGMSLINHLSTSTLSSKRVLLIDKQDKETSERTWCFWSQKKPYFADIVFKSWDKVNFTYSHHSKTQSIFPWKYHCIRGADFYRSIQSQMAYRAQITFKKATLKSIYENDDLAVLETDRGSYAANFVFNSIPNYDFYQRGDAISLKQHFYGLFIETEEPIFEADCMTLMNFQPEIYAGAGFFYILPFTAHCALIEFTVFSENSWAVEKYRFYLDKFIKDYLHIRQFIITDTEKGVIPMTDYCFPERIGNFQMQIGTAGGMTKPSTGYTFRNIQRQSQKIVEHLEKYQNPFYSRQANTRFRFYDRLFLNIIRQYPEESTLIFRDLFLHNHFKKVFCFLNEETCLSTELSIFSKLRWNPFLESIKDLFLKKNMIYDWFHSS